MTERDDWQRQWDSVARGVRSALAAATVEIVNARTNNLTTPDAAQVCAETWGDITDLMYPTTKETHS